MFSTSAQAAVLYLKQNYPGGKVYCQGSKSFFRKLQLEEIDVTEEVREDIAAEYQLVFHGNADVS